MGDDVKDITETAEYKENLDRARLARERREAEQRKRLDELRAHAAAAQAQREKRDEERRRRQAEQRARDDDRRQQVEERKRAIWEASVSRREALLQRERDRTERLERARAARFSPRTAFAFGSSTPRLLEPVDSTGFFWAARSTNPIDQINFFESLAASTTNVMFASAPLTRPASALQLDSEIDNNRDESDRPPQPAIWSSVARRRTDLVPTLPAPRAPGRAYSMTRLDKIPSQRPLHSASPSMHHLNRTQTRSGDTTPGSRPGSAMSNATGVMRRATAGTRKQRPASIAGTGVNTPRGGGDTMSQSVATTPSVSRDGTVAGGGDVPRRPQITPRRPRPVSMHAPVKLAHVTPTNPADGKPPVHRKPKPSKEEKTPRGKSISVSPGRMLSPSPGRALSPSPSPAASKEPSIDKEVHEQNFSDKNQVSAEEVTQKLEALQIQNGEEQMKAHNQNVNESKQIVEDKQDKEDQKSTETKTEPKPDKKENDKKESASDKTDDSDMTASMTARRITTEEQAKAALAERRRRAREELERQAELERQRLQREAEEEAERQRQEEERQRREEEEARELAQLQRRMEEEKLRKAIEAQQQLEREEADRKAREESERQARLKEEEDKRKAAEEAEKLRKEEAEKEEKERLARKQRVEAIMARTRLKKAEEDKKAQENKAQVSQGTPAAASPSVGAPMQSSDAAAQPEQPDNGNAVVTGDLLGFTTSQTQETKIQEVALQTNTTTPATVETNTNTTPNNGNVTADLLGLSEQNNIEDKTQAHTTATNNKQQVIYNSPNANAPTETNNGNVQHVLEPTSNVGHISANFIQTERMSAEHSQTKLPENVPKLIEDDFTAHNGHGATHNHPLTLQNAI
ncbi:MAP7 domain-containing protein 1-like isoform X2 [Hyposmocoma kahamanoa]|uniref:MAP7 domain-containing protein 1-like isoform X2 n=1 Tax=Hyposmocoma kahamanoa TaxID=1477025 RepID=UPI000E6D766B|nr:MAP7 domain-containing protein 1-like isoform X2 [Hyposmocoma kahamanoa]